MKKGEKRWYKSPSNWLVIVACIILVPILLANLFIIYQSKTNKDAVPSIFGYKPFIVLSGSMESDIHKGDLIITKSVKAENLVVNDIIAFRDAAGTITTHRIIDVVEKDGKKSFITKGDNNSTQDRNLVSEDDVEGIYVGRIPGLGSIMDKLSEPTTIIILVLGITIIFVIGFMISTKKQSELEKKEYMEFKLMKEKEKEEQLRKKKLKEKKLREEDKSQPKKKSEIIKENEKELEEIETKSEKNLDSTRESRISRLEKTEEALSKRRTRDIEFDDDDEEDDEYLEYLLKKQEAKLAKLKKAKELREKNSKEKIEYDESEDDSED